MKLSTKGRYGTRALLEMARHYGEGPMLLKDIAERQQISLQYLEHLIGPLVGAGLVKTTRGFKGGVWLARPPADIKLSEMMQLLEGDITLVECLNNPGTCTRSRTCATRDVWDEMKRAMYGVLDSTTLEDLVKRQEVKERTPQFGNYEI
ncbi:MAG: Rrf2 family transcriptional regulator [Dehalococcoidales bacterium]|jgi:Rrf2 family protein